MEKIGATASTGTAHRLQRSLGVRANAVSPAHVETPLTDRALADADARRAMISDIPLSRMAQPQEIADAIIFLASDQASFITRRAVYAARRPVSCSQARA